MDPPPNRDTLIQQFCSFTSASPAEAEDIPTAHSWDVETAVATWFASQEGEAADADNGSDLEMDPSPPEPQQPQSGYVPGGGRTLGGEGVPSQPATSEPPTSTSRRPPQRGGMRTLRDLQGDSHGGHGHAHDDDDSDEDQDFFAGGEKSGLAVQNPGSSNPRDQINSILDRARRNIPRPGGDEPTPSSSRFGGRGVTLGGEGADSRVIEDPTTNTRRPPPRVQRVLHLWSDGFSVDDGPLFRYDDPANAQTLQMINSGRAPLDLLNVEHGQEVDLQLDNQKESKYVQPKKKYVPFAGSGQRLGSPTPGVSTPPPAPAQSTAPSSSAGASAAPPSVNVNDSQPTIALQIRLGDGTRLQSRFNTTHTVGDVYSFVDAASPTSTQRAYALMTTFPSKELTNKDEALGDMAEFKRGGVVVQKWK